MKTENIVLLELDVCVPVQEFKIEYTLVESGGLPFVPEFVLRLLKISALLPADIAKYFGFSSKELETALAPLFQLDQISTQTDKRIGLSEKGQALFAEDENSPSVKSREEYRKSFIFDLLCFSCVGTKLNTAHPERSVVLDVGVEARSESTQRAGQAFQHNYLEKIYEKWDKFSPLQNNRDSGSQKPRPELYKVGHIERKRDSYQSIQEQIILDVKSADIYFAKVQDEILEDITHSPQYLSQRASKLSQFNPRNNIAEVAAAAKHLDDDFALDLLSGDGIDLQKIIQNQPNPSSSFERIYGAVQLKKNWDEIIYKILKQNITAILKQTKDKPVYWSWLVPASNGLWSKSGRHGQVLDEVAQLLKQDKSHQLTFELFYPIGYAEDKKSIKQAEKECKELNSHISYFIQSDKLSPLEIIVLGEQFAVVVYHLCNPDLYSTPIPFGYITTDKAKVKIINDYLNSTLNEYVSVNEPRLIRRKAGR